MKATRIHRYGDPDVLIYEDAPMPEPGDEEVLVRVHTAGVNPIDWKIRQGLLKEHIPLRLPAILGQDMAGTVEAVGARVSDLKPGDVVYGKQAPTRGGTYAEYTAIARGAVDMAPRSMAPAQAAGVPLAATTAWTALFDDADLRDGQTVLIHAGSGGVGHFAIQLARHRGARVITTTSAAHVQLAEDLGADQVIDYRTQDFSTQLRDVDVVLDTLGGATLDKSFAVLRRGGTLVSLVADPDGEQARHHGVTAKRVMGKSDARRLRALAELVDAGQLRVVIDREFPLREAAAAHTANQAGHTTGKIVLRVQDA